DNGLTYYIRHNDYPEHVANFYIAQKVGSINENDDQRGLAHLLEHMAFNGSDHFKGNSMQEYLQSIGVEYGRNLNAYTSTDQTVYYITDVPTARISVVDSCMLVLKDWSNGLTLTSEAIDEERDIVHNEYRMRIVGTQKILEQVLPDLYPGSKYGHRFPIGLMEIIDGCNPETLRAYYRKWYRPDNQGIIIVGDIDVDRTEQKIKELFGGITVPANAAKVELEPVPDNNEGIYVIGKDKEQQVSMFLVSMKHDATPDSLKNNVSYMVFDFARDVIAEMLNARFTEESQKPECPFLNASAEEGNYLVSRTKDAFTLSLIPKEGKELEGLATGLRELKRVKDFGFTATEYDRAKSEYISRLESTYNNREKQRSDVYCSQYVNNFIENEPIPSIEDKYQLMNQIVPMIPVEAINEIARQLITNNDTNFVVLAAVQEKDGKQYFTTDDMKKAVANVRQETLEAYVDNVKQEPLMAELPKAGSIVKEEDNTQLGFKKLTLSNGATVLMKKTDFNADQILMSAGSLGGNGVFGVKEANNLNFASMILSQSGLGNFSSTDLQKALSGKQCSTSFSISNSKHGLSGSTTPKDLETFMQLVHLDFTKVTKDEKAVQNFLTLLSTQLKTISLNNEAVFQDSVMSTVYNNNSFFRIPSAEDIDRISYDRVLEIWKELYGNAANFTFTFVGNYDETQLRKF
ncbi:MAG: insulinase family protein, partial [Prevotella sp.]|nr:insulinase family protein [Prevotella sp.]